ncbi:MAG: EAL domain-containing protein [Paenibacillaceae bacterium]|nr:EAL domain-containing protein [Paenibacillaceae bacterium]
MTIESNRNHLFRRLVARARSDRAGTAGAASANVSPEAMFHSLFAHNPIAIGIFDRDGRWQRANEAVRTLLGYGEEELRELTIAELLQEGERAERLPDDGAPLGLESRRLELTLRHRIGYRVDVDATLVPYRRGDKWAGYFAILQDMTKRKRTEQHIRHMAYYDDLTGLPNRRLFKEKLSDALQAARTAGTGVAVLFLDIDRFKLVNDGFGYEYGDMLLMHIAERFTHCIGEHDFLAHTEGDEFTFFYANMAADNIAAAAETIIGSLEEPFTIGEHQLHVTSSIGIAYSSPNEPEDADGLMKNADIALSKAKEKGRNNFQLFSSALKSMSIRRLKLESELRRALQEGQFRLYFQPQIDVRSGAIVGAEALVRWLHPERGLISPAAFIPIAEENGFIVDIGEWVLREACSLGKSWQLAGFPAIPVSVNLSVRQFLQLKLRDNIARILESTGLDPAYLELEITESMTMDVDYAAGRLQELKQLGLTISVDDFGTGYSSLSYLKKFPIDKLKIDRSFVRDIMTDPGDAAIVAAIIAMAHHLRLDVVAEGVETEDQLRYLHRNGCHLVQGYWYSPPLPADELAKLLAAGTQKSPLLP